jgi:hypothetical protein
VSAVERVFVAVHKQDIRLARICVASIRHWYPDIPIYLLKDEASGSFSTRELEDKWKVAVWKTPPISYGWGFIKLEPLFEKNAGRYLILDADVAFIGPLLDELQRFDSDFVVHGETQPPEALRNLYFDPAFVRARINQSFRDVPFTFNSGQYVATGGLLERSNFEEVLNWRSPPSVRFPEFFNAGDQGVLNYVVLKQFAEGSLTVTSAHFMKWGLGELEALDLAAIKSSSPYTALIHWAGMKNPRLGAMPRADILRFFEERYYSRILGGRARLIVRVLLDTVTRVSLRASRKVRKLFRMSGTTAPVLS